MNVTLLQWNTEWEDKQANFAKVRELVEAAAAQGQIDVVVLPELFAVGFTMNVDAVAEPLDGPTCSFLVELAAEFGIWIVGSVVVKPDDRGRNLAVTITPSGEVACAYAKIHPFSYGGEDKHYAGGGSIDLFDMEDFTACSFVCYDLRFPEIFRDAVSNGAELFFLPANWPAARLDHWRTLIRARAIENQSYVIASNRVGEGGGLEYSGHSIVVDPWGDVVGEMGDEEGFLTVEIARARLKEIRSSYPFLKDMQQDT